MLQLGLSSGNLKLTFSFYVIPVFVAFFFYSSITLTLLAASAQLGRVAKLAIGGLLGAVSVVIIGLQVRTAVYSVNLPYLAGDSALGKYIGHLGRVDLILDIVFDILVLLGLGYIMLLVKKSVSLLIL